MTRRSQGFVLVNALVLVAALAGIAVALLARAEGARTRQAETQTAAQIMLYLDAVEALALTLLSDDRAGGDVDHAGEPWASATYDVPLDRGQVTGTITDLQGRFNVNWLANPDDEQARAGFAALLAQLNIAPGRAGDVIDFLSPGGPPDAAAYARQHPAVVPVGGPVTLLGQLQAIPTLDARDFARLQPYVTALPGDRPLNVNTAAPQVLKSLLPGISAAAVDQLVRHRRDTPFLSVQDFARLAGQLGVTSGLEEADLGRFSVSSNWFELRITATLEGRQRGRLAVLERLPLPVGVLVAYRLDSPL